MLKKQPDPGLLAEAETVTQRTSHLEVESEIKTAGVYYMVAGFVLVLTDVLFVLSLFAGIWPSASEVGPRILFVALALSLVAVAMLMIETGQRMRKLCPTARLRGLFLAGLGLFFFPAGTLVYLAMFRTLTSKKGKTVLSEDYAEVMRQTPQLTSRVSVVSVVCITMLSLMIVVGFGFPMFSFVLQVLTS